MNIFDYLKHIIVTKNKCEQLDNYLPYLVTRWLSFINPTISSFLNNINKQVFLENKDIHYKTLLALFPKMKSMPRINYIKKIKEKETEKTEEIKILAQQLELSSKEVTKLISLNQEFIS